MNEASLYRGEGKLYLLRNYGYLPDFSLRWCTKVTLNIWRVSQNVPAPGSAVNPATSSVMRASSLGTCGRNQRVKRTQTMPVITRSIAMVAGVTFSTFDITA